MIINTANAKILNSGEIYIHDDILEDLHFDRIKYELRLTVADELVEENKYYIDFLNVVAFKMSSCDFWGSSPHIFDFEYVESCDNTIVPELLKRVQKDSPCRLDNPKKYFESVITFTSGDRLRITCESIVFSDDEAIKYKARTAQPE